jgi:DNA-binding transcriptional LysR family regulator
LRQAIVIVSQVDPVTGGSAKLQNGSATSVRKHTVFRRDDGTAMHIRSLKIFCDIVDQASFSRAAHANGVSQSNASQVVHQLEERLGVQLIDRSKRPFVLTPEGQRFQEGARVIVQRYDDLERDVKSLHEAVVQRITVASIYSVGLAHMSRYLREFLADNPNADVRLEYLHPHRVYEAVDSGQADLGLVSYPEESRSVSAIAWRSEPMALVCHPDHPLASMDHVSLMALQGESIVAFQKGLKIRDEIDQALAAHDVLMKVALEFDNIETIKRAIEIGAGVGLLPEPTVEREIAAGTLVKVHLDRQPLVRPLGIIHRRDRNLSETATQFVLLLQRHAAVSNLAPTNGFIARRERRSAQAVS